MALFLLMHGYGTSDCFTSSRSRVLRHEVVCAGQSSLNFEGGTARQPIRNIRLSPEMLKSRAQLQYREGLCGARAPKFDPGCDAGMRLLEEGWLISDKPESFPEPFLSLDSSSYST